jgi:NTP pyrophosphatase (non-canonical NTP hydrolase)
MNLEKLPALAEALHVRFGGREPFQIVTRLLEECGELAQEVNHFEGGVTKLEKYGAPSKEKFAKEVMDVLRLVFQIVAHYGLEAELAEVLQRTYQRCLTEGLTNQENQGETLESLLVRAKALSREHRLELSAALEHQSFYEKLGLTENEEIFDKAVDNSRDH